MISVNLCLFNNPLSGITDQVFFLERLLRARGYEVLLSDRFHPGALNLVIENYRPAAEGCNFQDVVANFCRRYDKRIGIVMTEHIERVGDEILFDGGSLMDTAYIGNRLARFYGLLAQSEWAFGFFTLGSLPELRSFPHIFMRHARHRLPFPAIDDAATELARSQDGAAQDKLYDCIFTGAMTPHRGKVLADLAGRYKLLVSPQVKEDERAALYRRAKVALNIPQDPSWPWVSPMRVLFGLRVGCPTIHVGGTRTMTDFDLAVPMDEEVGDAVADPAALYARQMAGYADFARESGKDFPDSLFRVWAELEGLPV